MTFSRAVVSGVAVGVLLVASPAFADWEAEVRYKAQGAATLGFSQGLSGRAFGSKAGLRMDFQTKDGSVSYLFDWKKQKGATLVHASKSATQLDLRRGSTSVPDCEGAKDIDACLVGRGYQRKGTESANGHPCTVYERKATRPDDKENVKLWRPTDLAEVLFVRTQTFDARGKLISHLDLTNVKVAPQPASLFTVPADYRKMDEGRPASAGSGGKGGPPGPIKPQGKGAKKEPAPGNKVP